MEKFELQMLRAIPIEDLASRLGLDVRHHKALCPFHNDHHASLSFNVRKNTYRCFVCDAHGDTIDLVRHLLNKDFQQACLYLSDGSCEPQHSTPLSPGRGAGERLPFDASKYERFFERPWLSAAARHFLFDQRRLDPRVIRWCRLTSWRDRQGTHWLQIPYFDPDGNLIGIQNRNLDYNPTTLTVAQSESRESSLSMPSPSNVSARSELTLPPAPRFRFPAGSRCTIYNLPVLNRLKENEPLYIAEGASDCWALLSAGHKAIAIPSATLLSKKDVELLLSLTLSLSLTFHMYPDRDLPGERLFLQLKELLPNLQHHQLPPGCKDYSDLYLQLHPPTTMNPTP